MTDRRQGSRVPDSTRRAVARALAEGMSQREAAREFSVSINVVSQSARELRAGMYHGIASRQRQPEWPT